MRVLVGCEFSGVVRRAFRALGHDAWSCDLLAAEDGDPHHLQCDVLTVLKDDWDIAIFHPPCTHLAVSGARYFGRKQRQQEEALAFVAHLLGAPIPRIALENPVSVISTRICKPTQVFQPWMFGEPEVKATCLWLRGLPPLQPTHLPGDLFCPEPPKNRFARAWRLPPSPDRWKDRSRTLPGVAQAMARQWGTAQGSAKGVDCLGPQG